MELCACCSGKLYKVCCQVYINRSTTPVTAEQLMRSRYTAYARCEIPYIINTTHPSVRGQYSSKSIKDWASSSVWKKLDIVAVKEGNGSDTIGYVEFKAYYSDSEDQNHIHHELSTFKKLDEVWYFVEGRVY